MPTKSRLVKMKVEWVRPSDRIELMKNLFLSNWKRKQNKYETDSKNFDPAGGFDELQKGRRS